jgi:hypothetical protein
MKGRATVPGMVVLSDVQSLLSYMNSPDSAWVLPDRSGKPLQFGPFFNRLELRRLVEAWNNAGRNAQKMLRQHRELDPYFEIDDGRAPFQGLPQFDGTGLKLYLFARNPVDFSRVSGDDPTIAQARMCFMSFLLNADRDRLSEKPCARCGNYYLKNTSRQKVYCSRKCGRNATAASATKKRLDAEHAGKLRIADELAQEWRFSRTKEGWKRWVSKQSVREGVRLTPNFLTRAVKKGQLTEPSKGGR